MKKEEIFVKIDSEEKRLRAIRILTDAGEEIFENSNLFICPTHELLVFDIVDEHWRLSAYLYKGKTEITLDELEQILAPNYAVKEVHLTIDEIRLQAEKLGFELVEKKREVKMGDFGAFWDDSNPERIYVSFFLSIEDGWFFDESGLYWQNFRHLTDEEKQKIQEAW